MTEFTWTHLVQSLEAANDRFCDFSNMPWRPVVGPFSEIKQTSAANANLQLRMGGGEGPELPPKVAGRVFCLAAPSRRDLCWRP